MMKPRFFLMPMAVLAVGLLLACGGDKKDAKEASNASGGGSSTSSEALDLTKSADKLSQLKSFRFDMTLKMDLGSALGSSASGSLPSGGTSAEDAFGAAFLGAMLGGLGDIKAEGSYVSPDNSDIRIKIAGQEIGMVQMGKKSWVKFGDKWMATDSGTGSSSGSGSFSMGSGSPAGMFSDILPNEVLKNGKTSQETVNGVKTTHYSFDKKALESLTKELGESTGQFNDIDTAKLDVWMNSDNVPVKLTMNMNGKDKTGKKIGVDMQVNLKDINSNIQIKAPI